MDRFGGKRVLITFLVLFFNSFPAYARDLSKTLVRIEGKASVLTIPGKSESGVTGSWDEFTGEGEAILKLDTIDTGISMRNKHMLTDLNVIKYPTAKLKFKTVKDSFSGTLTLNGISKPVVGSFNGSKFEWVILLSDFNIPRRVQLGMQVKDEFKITAEIK